ncbi:hypothetical protein TSA1_29695 [Bradyrhizobium nitroreducens]|uniref:PPM-type phosphatase domain-containing protein n=1 Tax=Bradyrhizobium nitroreducens TaxID=709803 RepID=A0A2M6UIX6_9BRAD|nr:hypothetical protein TSA1_29695 [Bradyrhizobium nitroreducens]
MSTLALKLAITHTRLSPDRFVLKLSDLVGRRLLRTIRTFAGPDLTSQRIFAFDFLMSTILGLVVTDKRFIVFHSGDGLASINGTLFDLESQAGTYLTNDLFSRVNAEADRPSIKLLSAGPTSTLNSIFLATDGLSRLISEYRDEFTQFANASPSPRQVRNGVDFLLQDFRSRLAWNPAVEPRLDDDATFVLLRRTSAEAASHDQDH